MSGLLKCKDCKYLQKLRSPDSAKKYGQIYECSLGVMSNFTPDDYCSKAEPWPILEKTIGDIKVRCPYCDTVWENISIPDAIWNSSSFMCPFCGKHLVREEEDGSGGT